MQDRRVNVNGREIAFTDIGREDGEALVFFHGAPASRLELAHLDGAFDQRGLRVITVDRPGYGATSPLESRSWRDAVRDTARVLDEMGIHRFVATGHSSGGPYALALAAQRPSEAVGVILLAAVTDMGWDGAWDGYPRIEIPMMQAATERDAVAYAQMTFGVDGAGFLEADGFSLPPPDTEALNDPVFAGALLASVAEAFRQGVAGYAQDIYVQGTPWDFAPDGIVAPVLVAHGGADDLVPATHSRHTSEILPTASLRMLAGHGHLTILAALPDVAATLVASAVPGQKR